MSRILVSLLASVLLASSVQAQGIRSVTRRTTTLERQQPARQFFDAAGVNLTGPGATPGAAAAATPAVVRRNSTLASQPRATPMLTGTARPPLRPAAARPYVLGPVKTGPATNVAKIANRPQPIPRHVAP